MATHLLFTGNRSTVYERWVAEPRPGSNGLWDISHQKYRMIVGKAHLQGRPEVVAEKLSVAEAIKFLEERENGHQGFRHISPLKRWRPDKDHYSRAKGLVDQMARRVSAQRMSKIRRRKPGLE